MGNGDRDTANFLNGLRDMMGGEWGWTPTQIEESLPKFVRILVIVGILRRTSEGNLHLTDLVEDDDAWIEVWAQVDKEEIGGSGAS